MKVKIWIHKADKRWWRYRKPTLLNTVGVKLDGAKPIYRWLWLGFSFEENLKPKIKHEKSTLKLFI